MVLPTLVYWKILPGKFFPLGTGKRPGKNTSCGHTPGRKNKGIPPLPVLGDRTVESRHRVFFSLFFFSSWPLYVSQKNNTFVDWTKNPFLVFKMKTKTKYFFCREHTMVYFHEVCSILDNIAGLPPSNRHLS